jgi:collagenase-like PrtC family protease
MKPMLSVPYVDEKDYLDLLFESSPKGIAEVYLGLPSRYAASGRAVYYRDVDYGSVVKKCHDNGAKVNVLVNSSCDGLEPYTGEGLNNLIMILRKVVSSGIDVVTVANPIYIPKIKDNFDVEIKASIISRVNSVQGAILFERLGADAINLDRDINRDLALMKEIREATGCRISILVNEGCLFHCPLKHFHDNMIGHLSRIPPTQRTHLEVNPFAAFCTLIKERDVSQILKSPWVRPEDLRHYDRLVDSFKISGRELPMESVLKIVSAYMRRRYDGNLMDLLNAKTPKVSIPNRSLDGFFERVTSCNKNCGECDYCGSLAKRIAKVDL